MSLLTDQEITADIIRSYAVHVPDDPVGHPSGHRRVSRWRTGWTTIARRWGVDPPDPVPAYLTDYLLVFPESDPRLGEEWVHYKAGDSGFPPWTSTSCNCS